MRPILRAADRHRKCTGCGKKRILSKIQIGFTFLVPAHPGIPGKRAVKRVCVSPTSDNFVNENLHTNCMFISTQNNKTIQNFIQLAQNFYKVVLY